MAVCDELGPITSLTRVAHDFAKNAHSHRSRAKQFWKACLRCENTQVIQGFC
jgi:hypothetical protein